MILKSTFFIIGVAGLFLIYYFLQPLKKGTGSDTTTKYELVKNWPDLPNEFILGNPTGICIDSNQQIVIFHRAEREWPLLDKMPDSPIKANTVLFINCSSGKLIKSWGNHLFIMPHGLTVDHENNIWVTDVGLHQVFKFSHNGKLLLTLGKAKVSGNDSLHFNKPTDVAIANDGSIFVSDGYGNSRVIKFSVNGKYLFEWGKKGENESEFNIPHALSLDKKGNLYVADRENNRIQVFDPNGKFIRQFSSHSFGSICSVTFNKTQSKMFAIDDVSFLKIKHRGSDVFVFDSTGKVQSRFGRSGSYTGANSWYHDLTIDKDDNIYVGDISGNKLQKFRKVSNQ